MHCAYSKRHDRGSNCLSTCVRGGNWLFDYARVWACWDPRSTLASRLIAMSHKVHVGGGLRGGSLSSYLKHCHPMRVIL